MSANFYNSEDCNPDNTIMYQAVIPRFFVMSPPSWNFVSPSSALMQRKITLLDLQRTVWNINQVSKTAFDDRMRLVLQMIGMGGAVAIGSMTWAMKHKLLSNQIKTICNGLSLTVAGGAALFVHQALAARKVAFEAVRDYLESELNPNCPQEIEWCLIQDQGEDGDEDWHHIVIKYRSKRLTLMQKISPSSGPNSCNLEWESKNQRQKELDLANILE